MIELAAMLRLIPYLLVAVISYNKGFYRLTAVAVLVFIITIVNFTIRPDAEMRSILSSIFSFALLLHALDLKPRKRK